MSPQTETMDIAMVEPSSSERPLFDEVIDLIQNNVLSEHLPSFHHNASASLLLDELRNISTCNGPRDAKLEACSHKIALFVRKFAPYFDVLSICVSLRPEWIGWFWGTVRLVYKMSSEHMLSLEKVASVFEAIAHILPNYQQIYDTCIRNISDSQVVTEDYHLAALMSCIYADIVQLCLDLYQIFCRGGRGSKLRHWTLNSTESALWRPLDTRFSRFEVRLAQHRKWLEKETRIQIQNYAEVVQDRSVYLNFLCHGSNVESTHRTPNEEERTVKRLKRVQKLRDWLSNCSLPFDVGQSSTVLYSMGSCDWFLKLPMFCKWKHGSFDSGKANNSSALESTWQHRLLFVQAKQGFGKTVLSHAVIEDLVATAEDPDAYSETPTTASFHFSYGRSERIHAEDAFRAIACQLLKSHRHNRSTLDLVCLLLRRTSFCDVATITEILDTLSILLRQHPTFLVFDGVDECSDIKLFFTFLAALCRKSDTKVILFSRPNIRIPLEYQKWASDAPHILSLGAEQNSAAIGEYVATGLNRMANQGFFGISMDRKLLSRVARVSNGNFLWARLVLKFLEMPLLTSEERHAILQNIQSLEGLDVLYDNILGALQRRSKHEKRFIADIFRWLSFSINKLSTSALQTVLLSFVSSDESSTANIVEAVPELVCGLLYVEDDDLFFSHRSIYEFLRSPTSQGSEFSLYDESNAHAHLAAHCLSYLAQDMPNEPLHEVRPPSPAMATVPSGDSGASLRTSKSGDSGYKSLSSSDGHHNTMAPTTQAHHETPDADRIPFDHHLPFLRYAALCWPIHLTRALSASDHDGGNIISYPFIPALYAFLSSRLAVTAWVEASFRYNLPPTLKRLVGPISDLKGEVSPTTIEGKQLRHVVHEMRGLSERLVELKREYEGPLRQNPSLIWQMDELGAAANREAYWPIWAAEQAISSSEVG